MKTLVKDAAGWGSCLWLIGYVLGIALFFVVPASAIGWVITPVGVALTVWVVMTRIRATGILANVVIATTWTAIAVVGDYLFIVKMLAPPYGYYKPDVYLYCGLTFIVPLIGPIVRGDVSGPAPACW